MVKISIKTCHVTYVVLRDFNPEGHDIILILFFY